MPNRIIRDGILTSGRVNSLDWPEEVFYRRLMSVVDDYGRFHGDPELLRPYLYPLKVDRVRVADISRWIAACVKAGLIAHYRALDDKAYIAVLNFGQQVRAQKSKFPDMPENASIREQMLADVSKCSPYSETETETETYKTAATSVATGIDTCREQVSTPANRRRDYVKFDWAKGDWDYDTIPESMAEQWRKAYPAVEIVAEMRKAALWVTANPAKGRKRDYNAFLVRWFAKCQERGGR